MQKKIINDWEKTIKAQCKKEKDYDLKNLYENATKELALQQSKRDQIITIYLALCSFLIPFALGAEQIGWQWKGMIFITLGIVGGLFAFAVVRYREYKEVYWICCQALTVLMNFEQNELDKTTVQQVFYYCLKKRGKGYIGKTKSGCVRMKTCKYIRKNIFSSETLHFLIIGLMASVIAGLGCGLACGWETPWCILFASGIGVVVLVFLLIVYFTTLMNIYKVLLLEKRAEVEEADLAEKKEECFNRVFSKAWFLHFYYEKD